MSRVAAQQDGAPAGLSGSAAEIAGLLAAAGVAGAELVGDGSVVVTGLAGLDEARTGDLSFVRSEKYAPAWGASAASAAIVSRSVEPRPEPGDGRAIILVDDADAAMSALLAAASAMLPDDRPPEGVHPSAVVDPAAEVDASARIGPLASVAAGAVVGPGAVLHAGARVGANARIGAHAVLHPNSVVGPRCVVGEGSILHNNASIGADGFGYFRDAAGVNVKIPHLGAVTLGAGCELGACSAIDRGKFGDTTLGDGVKIDNLCQIGHSATIGDHSLICGGSSIAGSVRIGRHVTIAGRVAISDGVTVGDGAVIGGAAMVKDEVPAGETWLGTPARRATEFMRVLAATAKLPELVSRIKKLERAAEKGRP